MEAYKGLGLDKTAKNDVQLGCQPKQGISERKGAEFGLDMPSSRCLWNIQVEIIQESGLLVRPSKAQCSCFQEPLPNDIKAIKIYVPPSLNVTFTEKKI